MRPSNATVTIDGDKFNALQANVEFTTHHDHVGMPAVGSLLCAISVIVDMHDDENLPFGTLSKLYSLVNRATRDKIKDMKVEFWKDENQLDALCTWSFRGWISHLSTSSGGNGNHTLSLSLQPTLDEQQFIDVKLGN